MSATHAPAADLPRTAPATGSDPAAGRIERLMTMARFPSVEPGDSGGLDEAAAEGLVTGPAGLAALAHGRVATIGTVAAFSAAIVCARARGLKSVHSPLWSTVEAEIDSRLAAPGLRRAWREQGGRLLRVALEVSDDPLLGFLARATVRHQQRPHHPVVVGAIAAVAGNSPAEAAGAAAWATVAPVAWAAARGAWRSALPAVLDGLNPVIERLVDEAVARCLRPPAEMPYLAPTGLAWLVAG